MIAELKPSRAIFKAIREKCKVSEFRNLISQYNKVNFEVYDNNGNTPLMVMLRKKNVPLAEYFIKTFTTNLNLKNKKTNETALEIAIKLKFKSIIKLIQSHVQPEPIVKTSKIKPKQNITTNALIDNTPELESIIAKSWSNYYEKILNEPNSNCDISIKNGSCNGDKLFNLNPDNSCIAEIKIASNITEKIETVTILKTPEFITDVIEVIFKHFQKTRAIKLKYNSLLNSNLSDAEIYKESLKLK